MQPIEFEIKGGDLQYVECILQPKETVFCEAGAMMYMEEGVQMNTKMGDGSDKHSGVFGSMLGIGKRYISGESFFFAFYTNNHSQPKSVAFAGNYPGKIMPVNLSECGEVFLQRGSFLCGQKGVAIEFGFSKKLGFALFGGEGFIMQKLSGEGIAFIHACGGMEEKTLLAGETIYVDTGSLVGFQGGMDYDIQLVKGLKNIFFGGEELFLTTITGPGKVWIQSLPYYRFSGMIAGDVLRILANNKR
jgi:uncharacterized protein (TIGR00266 family)